MNDAIEMEATVLTPNEKANAFYNLLVLDERPDGEKFVRLVGGSPAWAFELVRQCHDGMWPDDTKYRMIREVAATLSDTDSEEWEEWGGELVDGLVDIYNTDRLKWLSSHLDRAWYVNEALSAYGAEDIFTVIGQGQYLEYREVFETLSAAFLRDDDSEEDSDE